MIYQFLFILLKRNTYLFKLKESVICNNDFRKFETCSSYIGSLDKMSAATYTFYASKVCNFLQTKRNTELFIPSKLLPDHFAKSTIDNFSSKKKSINTRMPYFTALLFPLSRKQQHLSLEACTTSPLISSYSYLLYFLFCRCHNKQWKA